MEEAIYHSRRILLGFLVVVLLLQRGRSSLTSSDGLSVNTTSGPFSNSSRPPPVHGGYSGWSVWTPCTKSCSGGSRFRSRSCTNPVPQFGGRNCSGPSSETQSCKSNRCPVDGGYGQWSDWTPCPVTCGGAQRMRTRSCANPTPMYGGRDCSHLGTAVQRMACNARSCPVHGRYSLWSGWSLCSAPCGEGTQERTRACVNPAPRYGGNNCDKLGSEKEMRVCSNKKCPVDGGYSRWSGWSRCSVTCGGGFKNKTRTCTKPEPKYGGKDCKSLGPSLRSRACNTKPCPVHGGYSQWSDWSRCTVACGEGRQNRTRMCTNPTPAHGGKSCSHLGKSVSWKFCNNHKCSDVDEGIRVMQYSGWSRCSSSCGGGMRRRDRLCEAERMNCSLSSTGNTEWEPCNTQPCVEFLREPLNIGLVCGGLVLMIILFLVVLVLIWRKWRSTKPYDSQPADVGHIGGPLTDFISTSPSRPYNQITLSELRQSRTDMIDNPLRIELEWEKEQFDKSPRYTAAPGFPEKTRYNDIETTDNELATLDDFVFYRRPHESMNDLEKEAGKIFDVKMIRPGYDEYSLPRSPKDSPPDEDFTITPTDDDEKDKVPTLPRKSPHVQNGSVSEKEVSDANSNAETEDAPPLPARATTQSCLNEAGRREETVDDDEDKPPLIPRKSTTKAPCYKNDDKCAFSAHARPATPDVLPQSPNNTWPPQGTMDMFDKIIRELETVQEVDTDAEFEGEKERERHGSGVFVGEGERHGSDVFERQSSEVYFEMPPIINRDTKKRKHGNKNDVNCTRNFNRENSVEI